MSAGRASISDIEDDPYEILGLQANADTAEIRKAFHSLALRWHPDKHPVQDRFIAEQRFKTIGGAYEVLSDPQRRQSFNRAHSADGRYSSARTSQRNSREWRPSRPASARPASRPSSARPSSARQMPAADERQRNWGKSSDHRIPERRVWFARASASVGRAYKGLEAEDLARSRQEALESIAAILVHQPDHFVDIRGCAEKGEVSQRQLLALGAARGEHTFKFFVERCQVPADQCRLADPATDFQGVEFRTLTPLQVQGQAVSTCKIDKVMASDLNAISTVVMLVPSTVSLLVEMSFFIRGDATSDIRAAQRRIASIRCALEERGIARQRLEGRTRSISCKAEEGVIFFLCDNCSQPL